MFHLIADPDPGLVSETEVTLYLKKGGHVRCTLILLHLKMWKSSSVFKLVRSISNYGEIYESCYVLNQI